MFAGLYTAITLLPLLPEIILALAACAVLIVGQSGRASVRRTVPHWTLGAIALALAVLKFLALRDEPLAGGCGLVFDSAADFVRTSALILGVVLTLVAWSQPTDAERGEFFSMMLFSIAGLMLVGPAADLVVLFLALELVSIPSYVMVTLSRTRRVSLEAGTKYFYLGAFSAAIMAYGFALLYGVSGTAALYGPGGTVQALADALADASEEGRLRHGLAVAGLVISLGGLLFKIAAVPLHFYIADVYQGAASAVAGFLGFVPKLAGMAAILKLVDLAGWQTAQGGLFWLLWLVAVASMTVGNVLALMQTNVKRMLAYSGVAHSGYMLVGVLAGPTGGSGLMGDGAAAVFYYVVIYGLANLAAFALLGLLRVRGQPCETVRDVAGLLGRHPGLALLMALAMFTLMGLPPTAGFWGKLALFGSALSLAQSPRIELASQPWIVALVVLALLNSALAAAYYLRVIAAVLLYENDRPAEAAPREALHMGALLCGMLILIFTFQPGVLFQASRAATQSFRVAPLEAVAGSRAVASGQTGAGAVGLQKQDHSVAGDVLRSAAQQPPSFTLVERQALLETFELPPQVVVQHVEVAPRLLCVLAGAPFEELQSPRELLALPLLLPYQPFGRPQQPAAPHRAPGFGEASQ